MHPGQGSLYQLPDGRWVAQISIGGRTQRSYRKRIRHSYAAARDALKQLRADADRGLNPTKATLSGYLEQWVSEVRNVRDSSRQTYQVAIDQHIAPAIGHVRLAQLQPGHVESLLAQMGHTHSPRTVRKIHGTLRKALNDAVRRRLIPANVAGREFVDPPRVPAAEPRALSHAEVRRLLTAAAGHRYECLVTVAVGTGLRSGELRALAWEDVDLEGPAIQVRHSLRRVIGATRRSGRYVRDELKTERSRRRVPLSPSLVDALRRHKARLVAEGFVPTATGPVFPNTRGGPLADAAIDHAFHDMLAAAGIPRAPFKVLRATFASRLFAAGVPDRRVADLLGHTKTRVTHGHYIGAGDDWTPAIAAVEELVG